MSLAPGFNQLVAFENTIDLSLCAQAAIKNGNLNATFRLAPLTSRIKLAPPNPTPARRDALWQTTCFEVFTGETGRSAYWEFNFSPSGDFACYRFDDYRLGMAPEERVTAVTCAQTAAPQHFLEWRLQADVAKITELNNDHNLELGLCAVIENLEHKKTCWALAHRRGKPDFHARESFILRQK